MSTTVILTDILLGASAIGTIALAVVGFISLRNNARDSRESQQQAQESLEASQRPYLYPFGPLEVTMYDGKQSFDFEHLDPGQTINIKNSGAGIALNVRGALMPAPPCIQTGIPHPPRTRTVVGDPLSAGEVAEQVPTLAGPFQFGWDTVIGSDPPETLAAPADAIVRLTLTYQDVFGHTHASQFDYTNRGVTGPRWVFHRFYSYPTVPYDLEALAQQHDRVNARNQAAFLNSVAGQTRLPPPVNREPAK